MKTIALSRNGKKAGLHFAIVPDELFDKLNGIRWSVTEHGTNRKVYYAYATIKGKGTYMHRYIWELLHGSIPEGYDIDHKDHNGLNNVPSNLKSLPHQLNSLNRGPYRTKRPKSSQYKGVSKRGDKWLARCKTDKPTNHIGYYSSEIEAALAYDEVAFAFDPEHFQRNFPDGWREVDHHSIQQEISYTRFQLSLDL